MIWGLLAKGVAEEEVAAKMHTDLEEIGEARVRMLAAQASVSHDIVDMVSNGIAIEVGKSGRVRDALNAALTAKRAVITSAGAAVHPVTGELITEPDVQSQLDGVKTWGSLIKNARASGGGVNIGVNVAQSNTQNTVVSGGRSFEARRRAAAERRGVVVDGNSGGTGTMVAEAVEGDEEELDDPDDVDDDEGDEDDE